MIHDNRVQRRDYGGDFSSDRMTFTETRSYEPGIGRVDHPLTLADAEYYHTDMLGSTRIMTDLAGNGIPDSEAAYTAFGEVVPGSGTHRFGYAGAHGYQAPTSDPAADPYATDFPFLHVGHRYYDPGTGRFLQRDPIGIEGGTNVYAYVGNAPTIWADPGGLAPCRKHKECRDWNDRFKKKPNPFVDLEKELRKERNIQSVCYAGLVVAGGVEAVVTKSLIGAALPGAGVLAWIWDFVL